MESQSNINKSVLVALALFLFSLAFMALLSRTHHGFPDGYHDGYEAGYKDATRELTHRAIIKEAKP